MSECVCVWTGRGERTAPEFAVRSPSLHLVIPSLLLHQMFLKETQKNQASFLSSHKQRFTFKQATSSQVLRKKKPNFTTLIEPLKKNTHLFFLAQITSHNPNQLNPSADCSLQAGGQIGNVWNQYEHSRSTCRIVGVTANSTELTGCRGLISISHY